VTLPLEGLRAIDLTRASSGPFCSMILADIGAGSAKWSFAKAKRPDPRPADL
jgi:crotonobetainyl-CoA:carnitine CoA-transferase CaiB-like acyl-CoA transferase